MIRRECFFEAGNLQGDVLFSRDTLDNFVNLYILNDELKLLKPTEWAQAVMIQGPNGTLPKSPCYVSNDVVFDPQKDEVHILDNSLNSIFMSDFERAVSCHKNMDFFYLNDFQKELFESWKQAGLTIPVKYFESESPSELNGTYERLFREYSSSLRKDTGTKMILWDFDDVQQFSKANGLFANKLVFQQTTGILHIGTNLYTTNTESMWGIQYVKNRNKKSLE